MEDKLLALEKQQVTLIRQGVLEVSGLLSNPGHHRTNYLVIDTLTYASFRLEHVEAIEDNTIYLNYRWPAVPRKGGNQ